MIPILQIRKTKALKGSTVQPGHNKQWSGTQPGSFLMLESVLITTQMSPLKGGAQTLPGKGKQVISIGEQTVRALIWMGNSFNLNIIASCYRATALPSSPLPFRLLSFPCLLVRHTDTPGL